ncbi:MAG: response regulator transcription factor [Alphaproteobacteria bacterium]|nr:response regulator transcription factor [Alphaproteobacteria bacterium]
MFENSQLISRASREARPSLVVLDDDPVTRSMIGNYFSGEGFDVQEAGTASECRKILKRGPIDLLFVDIRLPDANGISFSQEVRAASQVGIIFVTQNDNEIDRVVGLESAGDDYVTKPVNLRELMARARALLRRRKLYSAPGKRPTILSFGPYILDLTRRELAVNSGEQIALTRGEFDLLAALVEAEGRPLYRDFLAEVVSTRSGEGDTRTVDSLVSRLRRKLNLLSGLSTVIVTVPGVGYRFAAPVVSS